MTIYLPGRDDAAVFGPPLDPPAEEAAPPRPEVTAALDRMQAEDDALFVATSLADLAARHGAGLRKAEAAAFDAGDDGATGFTAGLLDGLAADVESRVTQTMAKTGARPSDDALDLFRRQADGLGRALLGRAALGEQSLRRHAQARSALAALDGLAGLVAADPDTLDDAEARADAVLRAATGLLGVEMVGAVRSREPRRLAEAALAGLIAEDPDEALARLASGAFDHRLDADARARFRERAEGRKAALTADAERTARVAALAAERQAAARSFTFEREFRRRIADSTATLAELADAEADGALVPAQAARLRNALAEADRASDEAAAAVARVAKRLAEGGTLDPMSPDDRTAATAYFENVVGDLDALAPEDRIAATADYTALTGIAPEPAALRLAGDVLFGPPALRMHAARAINTMVETDRGVGDLYPPEIVALAGRLAALDRIGVPADRAAALLETGDEAGGDHGEDPGDAVRIANRDKTLKALFDWLLRRARPPQPDRTPPEPGRGVPLPPLPGGRPRDEDDAETEPVSPGPGHNRPPEAEDEPAPGVRDVELRPGITVRGDPASDLWKRFTDMLSRIPGEKSRSAVEGAVNSGELTTDSRAAPDVSNITRKGGIKESLEVWEQAVRDAGGDPNDIAIRWDRKKEFLRFTAEDNTEFLHFIESKSGPPTVYIQIRQLGQTGRKTEVIKIRFEE